jgi:hypothetical protein
MDFTDDNDGGGSSRKRERGRESRETSEDLDDLVGQICSKLTNLKTLDKQQHIDAFIEVLECTSMEATFFLDSSSWDIGTAVGLFIEEQQFNKRRATNAVMRSFMTESPTYQARTVVIDDLPEGWSAAVSPRTGQVVFFHSETMVRQYAVPPGFANPIPETIDLGSSSHLGGGLEFSDAGDDDVPPLMSSPFDEGDGGNASDNEIIGEGAGDYA